jgi:cysteine synthase B
MPTIELELGISVGNTPLIEFNALTEGLKGVRIFGKAEWRNPGGSIKDRAALSMVREGFASGDLAPGGTLLDATSGNTGIAYSWLGTRLGFDVVLCVPESIAPGRRRILDSLGAKLELTSALESSDGAIRACRALYEAAPEKYFFPDQYNNPANWKAHYETTAEEIWRQTRGHLTHFVAGLGTSGTFNGTSRRLRELNASIELVSVQPDSPMHGLEGLKHMASAIVPGIHDPSIATAEMFIPTEEAQDVAKRVARREGLLVGPSGGANLAACVRLARDLAKGRVPSTLVTILPDSGERYLEHDFWRKA